MKFKSMLVSNVFLLNLFISTSAGSDDATMDSIITWIRSKQGGFFSDNIEIRRIDPADVTSYFGVFAKRDIKAKEDLMKIPHECYIEAWEDARVMGVEIPKDYDILDQVGFQTNTCLLSHKLRKELKLGKNSSFAPYITYLKSQKPGQLPAMWSTNGKDILRKVLEPGSDGVDWMDWYFLFETGTSSCISSDPFEMLTLTLTVQRGFDNSLIPVWDMVNHDSGGLINTETDSLYGDEGGVKVKAAVDIKAGEELFHSYIDSFDNNELYKEWGTFQILKNFGFVEGYPHRWINYEKDVWFEIWEEPDGELRVSWPNEKTHGQYHSDIVDTNTDTDTDTDDIIDKWWKRLDGPPNARGIQYLGDELQRLRDVKVEIRNLRKTAPKDEWDIIMNYLKAAINDYSTALNATFKRNNSNTTTMSNKFKWDSIVNYNNGATMYDSSQETL